MIFLIFFGASLENNKCFENVFKCKLFPIMLMEEGAIVLSYETLFEMLRLERSRTELQCLPSDFIENSRKLIEKELELLHRATETEKKHRAEA